ncbi:hypothetical protein GIB67_021888 [Kingdonia uniflora]|uniref:Bifunctional inhibitor/plant lipid transfer protein/seed storage helical domain-containing protein n=1 Tax=Kingdonia uniflora TaxID=39325 RepID=A0A7J7KVB4_9MAGN|nr:hypothetical protein GIB67_021888 [Kingdonia uniflora]
MSKMIISVVVPILVLFAAFEVNPVFASGHHHQHNDTISPTPLSSGGDCSTIVMDMASCLTFVGNDSIVSEPDADCCTGLKSVIKTNADCVCESFTTAAQMGIGIDLAKAAALPSQCGVSLPPSVGTCGFSAPPSADTAQPPKSSPGGDCSTIVMDMASCLTFVGNDSTVSEPDADCCAGLKSVIKTNVDCVCESFTAAAQMGIGIDLAKAAALPSQCGVSLPPSVGTCGFSAPPSADTAQPPKSSPGGDCSTIVMDMASCLTFVGNDSTVSEPDADCCAGLKTVIKTNADCVCESFTTAAQMGIGIDLTKAAALPSQCGVSLPPFVGTCGFSAPPSATSAQPSKSPSGHHKFHSPKKSPSLDIPAASVPSGESGDIESTPPPVSYSVAATPSPSSSPSGTDCSTLVLQMTACLSFTEDGSKDSEPGADCCNGLKTVLETKAECVCESFSTAAQMGIVIDVERAAALPSTCGLSLPPSVGTCGFSAPPSGAPAPSVEPLALGNDIEGPAPVPVSVPAPPTNSDSSVVPVSILVVIASIVVASGSYLI